jgi:hypothetical protein
MKTVYYFKSEYTGQVYCMDEVPQFGGFILTDEAEFLAWCQEHGHDPDRMR